MKKSDGDAGIILWGAYTCRLADLDKKIKSYQNMIDILSAHSQDPNVDSLA